MQTISSITEILKEVDFYGYVIEAKTDGRGDMYMQGLYFEEDVYTDNVEAQHTRKWLLSPLMTDSEIVQTAFKLCITSMEHRTREGFTYKGARVFGPHFDVEDLVTLCKDRENAGGRNPKIV